MPDRPSKHATAMVALRTAPPKGFLNAASEKPPESADEDDRLPRSQVPQTPIFTGETHFGTSMPTSRVPVRSRSEIMHRPREAHVCNRACNYRGSEHATSPNSNSRGQMPDRRPRSQIASNPGIYGLECKFRLAGAPSTKCPIGEDFLHHPHEAQKCVRRPKLLEI